VVGGWLCVVGGWQLNHWKPKAGRCRRCYRSFSANFGASSQNTEVADWLVSNQEEHMCTKKPQFDPKMARSAADLAAWSSLHVLTIDTTWQATELWELTSSYGYRTPIYATEISTTCSCNTRAQCCNKPPAMLVGIFRLRSEKEEPYTWLKDKAFCKSSPLPFSSPSYSNQAHLESAGQIPSPSGRDAVRRRQRWGPA
jgi:hypothetical protein